jgi:pyruvate formate lyase activating enzyme
MARTGRIFDIQPFSLHDGPGTRTTVFLQGCNLCCGWCHNPESQPIGGALLYYPARCIGCGACAKACPHARSGTPARHGENCALCGACAEACFAEAVVLAGREIGPDELCEQLLSDLPLYRESGGGVTFSGGEPLLQPEFLGAALARLKAAGVHAAVETALNVPWEDVAGIMGDVDLFFADLKCATDEVHRENTGVGNARILANIRRLSESGAEMVLRIPVVPGFNADGPEMERIAAIILSLSNRHPVELLAYHGMCAPKYAALGRKFPWAGFREPGEDEMLRLIQPFLRRGIDAKYVM